MWHCVAFSLLLRCAVCGAGSTVPEQCACSLSSAKVSRKIWMCGGENILYTKTADFISPVLYLVSTCCPKEFYLCLPMFMLPSFTMESKSFWSFLFVSSRVRIQIWITRLHSLPIYWRFGIVFAMIPKVMSSFCAVKNHFRSLLSNT